MCQELWYQIMISLNPVIISSNGRKKMIKARFKIKIS
jgi:hypothetical protein